MDDKGKSIEANINFLDFNYSSPSEITCQKHPIPSSVGICAQCLKEKLMKLICSDCGEQRLSSCSCSDVSSSYRNSCSSTIGSVGRISFLLENEKIDQSQLIKSNSKSKLNERVIFLRRSASSCVEVKKRNGFWRIKRLFRKKSKLGFEKNGEISDNRSEIWVSDIMGVSRSRSLCSFRGGDEGSDCAISSAKISDVTNGIFSEFENRRNNQIGFDRSYSVQHKSVFPVKESDFTALGESDFIDLKLDSLSSAEPKKGLGFSAAARVSGASDTDLSLKNENIGNGGNFANLKSNGVVFCNYVNDRGLKKESRRRKVWKWIFKYRR